MITGNHREIGALIVLFMSAKFFEGGIQVPDARTMIVSLARLLMWKYFECDQLQLFGILGFVGMFINQVS